MIHQTELRDLLPGMVPFPADVFTADQSWLGQHLLPLLKIDLGVLRPELAGQVATIAIVMLYEPVSRTVLFSYDWS